MGEIAQLLRLFQNIGPAKFVHMAVIRERVGHDLKSVVQRAIVFRIGILLAGDIRLLQNGPGVAVAFAAAVDLQLYAKVAGTLPVEEWDRFVIVVLDLVPIPTLVIAVVAVGAVIFLFLVVVGVIIVDEATTDFAGGVTMVTAVGAEVDVPIACIILIPDALTTAGAGAGVIF